MAWTHATNSRTRFEEAVADSLVSAIECDVLMSNGSPSEPILAHPPSRESDLTAASMLQLVIALEGKSGKRILRKHLKLDFKEIDAVAPTLDLISSSNFTNEFGKEITLNADILAGPGFGANDSSIVPAIVFLETCLKCIEQLKAKYPESLFGLSLGFKCNWQAEDGYSEYNVSQMSKIVQEYHSKISNLRIRIVLALNARQLVKSLPVFDALLSQYPESNILAWTGSGEPPIPRSELEKIKDYYGSKKIEERIEFDCTTIE